jgi:hypothetical protein
MLTDLLPTYTSECILAKAHVLEAFIDMLFTDKPLPSNWEQQLAECQGKVLLFHFENFCDFIEFFLLLHGTLYERCIVWNSKCSVPASCQISRTGQTSSVLSHAAMLQSISGIIVRW